ncbi:hypothetical protein [Usitatibacter palustris]|uniref:hypothetical protein n=1 Tax=Usitatibacter palustris TaxID=2732487 RepID=UPI00148A026B|nr:hypothetical protein [Usitatibacter palustris]
MSNQIPKTLNLVRGETLLGTIDVKPGTADVPWFSGAFHATPEFESVRDLFERELQLLQENSNDDSATWDDWEEVHAEIIDPGLRLQAPDSSYVVEDILIHIDGAEAWWRE